MLWALLAGCAAAALSTRVATAALVRRSVLDVPNHRSSHRAPIPRGGGVALLVGVPVALLLLHGRFRPSLLLAVFLPAAAAAAVGLTDDVRGEVSVRLRLVALVVIASAGAAAEVSLSHPGFWAVLVAVVIALWVVSYTNFFNFMDGINGIASSQAILTGICFGLIAAHLHRPSVEAASFALAAAGVGFLPFNFPSARVFLGDVGSYFLGASLALLIGIAVLRGFTVEAAVAPVAVFLTDAGVTLIRRIAGRKAWATAHREHTYQRLVDAGWSHTLTTSVVAVFIAACSALGSVSLLAGPAARALADAAIVVLLAGYLSLPSLQARLAAPAMPAPTAMTGGQS